MSDQSSIETQKVAGAISSMGIDELIFNMAKGIADGQARLDETCMALAVQMGDAQIEFGKIPGTNEPDLISLVELGFTPNFYQFVDTILEIRVSVSSQYEEEKEVVKSDINTQSDEKQTQSQYSQQKSNNYHGYGYGRSWGWGYGYAGRSYGWGYGGHGYGYSGGSSSSGRVNTNEKSKAVKVNTVDASFASKYGYEVAASSLIKTKIVPIPPPQVLEEAVQNAAKERKEWAKRYALLRFSKTVLPAISTDAESINTDLGTYLVDGAELPKFSEISEIKIGLEALNDEYAKLTNDHWSVIEDVKDRRILDTSFENIIGGLDDLMSFYDVPNKQRKASAIEEDLKAELQNNIDRLNDLKTKIDEIMERLPLTPEEQAAADQAQEDTQGSGDD